MRLKVLVPVFLFSAIAAHGQAIDSLRRLLQAEPSESKRAELLRSLSYEYLNLQDLDNCLTYAQQGVELAQKAGNKRAEARNLEMIGNFYYYKGMSEKAMDVFLHILKIAEETNDEDLLARSYSMMGWIYMDQRRFDGAIEVFSKALAILSSPGGHSEYLALTYYGLASVYSYRHSDLRNLSLAKSFYDSALRVSPGLQKRERAFALTELGATHRDADHNFTTCLEYLHKAEALLIDNSNHLDAYAYLSAEMASTYSMMNDFRKAAYYASQSHRLYEALPLHSRIPSVYELLAETYERMGDFRMAFTMENLNRVLSDSLFNRKNILLVEQLRTQYEDDKKKDQIERLSKANLEAVNNRNIALVVGAASVSIFVLVSVIYYNRNRYQKKIQLLRFQQTLREERDRIARDLHDSLGGQLSSISMGLNGLAHGNKGSVEAIQNMVDKALGELRNALWVMDKESISIAEIEQRINNLFWQYRKIDTPVDLQVKITDDLPEHRLSATEAGHLYRIMQEATTNSVKHSKATHFQVSIEKLHEHIQVTMADNGIGLKIQEGQEGEHYGFRNMKARAKQINAEFIIESAEGVGTTIKVVMPMTCQNG